MPFTFAHPAYALPSKFIYPRCLSVTGLVLGSMAPDFEYFLSLEPHQMIGHSFTGLFVQVIPLCILFAYLFHTFVKESFVLHLPDIFGLNRKAYNLLCSWSLRTLRDWIVYLVSVSVGFLSHIAVDAFTHERGYMVQQLPMLQSIVILDLPVYKILQHSLSMIGMAVIIAQIGVALYRTEPRFKEIPIITCKQKLMYWGFAVMVAVLMTGCKLLFASGGNILGMLVVAPITGFCAGIFLASLPFWRRSMTIQ
ncbi:DUF4184 family protein [Paenibacillus lignilyticus]|uniref:DUF4184 family protein n=1 Tax=Paenibacillus lignilyticus TaxID=1172615 RepID=A0ABS5CCU2_9BACL|nr:DUF4184 family protein [Paenibacillus lignilyticus]MBP3963812.1 DUF4184 family protein [Paenibacillus lignilyticus]